MSSENSLFWHSNRVPKKGVFVLWYEEAAGEKWAKMLNEECAENPQLSRQFSPSVQPIRMMKNNNNRQVHRKEILNMKYQAPKVVAKTAPNGVFAAGCKVISGPCMLCNCR